MRIRIKGTPNHANNRVVCKALRFFARTLMSESLLETLHITVCFQDSQETKGFKAALLWTDKPGRPKRYQMIVRETLNLEMLLKSLAHEMVHVKQYATGQMYDYQNDPDFVRWENERYEFADDLSAKYWFAPWEVEAYGKEVGLFKLFVQSLK